VYQLDVLKPVCEMRVPVSEHLLVEIIFQSDLISMYFCPKETDEKIEQIKIKGRIRIRKFIELIFSLFVPLYQFTHRFKNTILRMK
jgi:hypothetical protein